MNKIYMDVNEGTLVELIDIIEEFGEATAVIQFEDHEYAVGFFNMKEFDTYFEFLGWV